MTVLNMCTGMQPRLTEGLHVSIYVTGAGGPPPLPDRKDTDKPSQSWIGDWWEGWGFACLASDPHRLTLSDSVSLSLTY